MTDLYQPSLFTRHNRPLHALWLESQAWFCAQELGRLIGRCLDERGIRKLDPDQHRSVQLMRCGKYQHTLMVSESGAYTLLAHHHTPENRHLRQWLTNDVVAALRDGRQSTMEDLPRIGRMCWPGGHTASLLYWQSEAWVRMRDMPAVMAAEVPVVAAPEQRKLSWKECAQRALRLHGVGD